MGGVCVGSKRCADGEGCVGRSWMDGRMDAKRYHLQNGWLLAYLNEFICEKHV